MPASRIRLCALTFLLLVVVPEVSRADLALTVDSSTASAGGTGSFDVVLSNMGGATTFGVGGFSVEISVDAGSGVMFTGVSVATTADPYIFGTLQSTQLSYNHFPTTDFIASDSDFTSPYYVNVAPGSSFGLEHVTYSVAAGTAAGPIAVSIVGLTGLAPTTQIDDIDGNPFPFTPANGTITVPAVVPEPSSIVLCATGLIGAFLTLLTRRGKATPIIAA